MAEDRLRAELETKSHEQLVLLATKSGVSHAGKDRTVLVDELLEAGKTGSLRLMLRPLRFWSKNDVLTITLPDPGRSRRNVSVYFAVFGAAWLLVEPLSSFTRLSLVAAVGWWGYVILASVSFLAALLVDIRYRRMHLVSHDLVSFYLVFPKSGQKLLVRAPWDMQIESFLRALSTPSGLNSLLPVDSSLMHLYRHNLMIKKGKRFRPIDSRLTLREAGVEDGSNCRLRGYVRVEYTRPLLDIEYSWQPFRLELARLGGLVVLDERDCVDYETAKARGWLTSTAIGRVDAFPYRAGADVFVHLCPDEEIDHRPALAVREELP